MGKTTRNGVPKIKADDAALAATFEAAVAAETPPAPPAPPVEDLSLPLAVWPEKVDTPKARIFARWGDGVADMFRSCAKAVQDAIIRNLAVAVSAGEVPTNGVSDGKAITPVSATLFAELRAKAETFLASLPIVDRGLAAERVKEAQAFVVLMAEKNPGLDLAPELYQADLAFRRVSRNFLIEGVDFKPAVEQAEDAAKSASRVTEDFLAGQVRAKAEEAGQDSEAVEKVIGQILASGDPSDRRNALLSQLFAFKKLTQEISFSRPTTARVSHDAKRARFDRRR